MRCKFCAKVKRNKEPKKHRRHPVDLCRDCIFIMEIDPHFILHYAEI